MGLLEQSKAHRRGFTNFCMPHSRLLLYRDVDGPKHQIEIEATKKIDQSDDASLAKSPTKSPTSSLSPPTVTYTYDGVFTSNIYALIVRTSLAAQLFARYPCQLIAVTHETLALPYEQQPWFRGIITYNTKTALSIGELILHYLK